MVNPRNKITWIQSYTGKRLWPLRPRVEDVDIEDIAHALSNKCRFTGHCTEFYSVAQHSVLVSEFVERPIAIAGLMHDASEYILPDVSTPVKHQLKGFQEIEEAALDAIFKKFGILEMRFDDAIMAQVKEADLRVLAIEARDLMPNHPEDWQLPYEPDPYTSITPWPPKEAKRRFMSRYEQILATMQNPESLAMRVE